MNKLLIIAVLTLSILALLAGCQGAATSPSTSPSPSSPVIITDDLGRSVSIKTAPQRIISLAPSNTEILFSLGLDDKIVGVSDYCNYPEAAKSKPHVAGYSTPDIEKIVSLQPDLVLASDIHKTEVIPALEKLGITVLAFKPATLDAVMKDISLAGSVTGRGQSAGAIVSSLQKRIQAVADKTAALTSAARPRVLYITWHDPLWTAGRGTIIHDLIEKAGGINIAADLSGYANITLEAAIQRNPQVILVMSSMGTNSASFDYVKTEPRFQAVDAVKNNRVYKVDADIFGRTTPRIVDGLEQLAGWIHPELFP
jgi:iron complex transport system substrate-binding protein